MYIVHHSSSGPIDQRLWCPKESHMDNPEPQPPRLRSNRIAEFLLFCIQTMAVTIQLIAGTGVTIVTISCKTN